MYKTASVARSFSCVGDTVLAHLFVGSPPHTRGKEKRGEAFEQQSRITPAYAGKSDDYGEKRPWKKDHPRIRGEKRGAESELGHHLGSPPHTRGKAANTAQIALSTRDHPRIRGEKYVPFYSPFLPQGSPPHTRGKDIAVSNAGNWIRITPAYAGKSICRGRQAPPV